MIELTERSYTNGRLFRPKPTVLNREDESILLISTSWGAASAAERVNQIILEQLQQLSQEDMTSAFENLPTLSTTANRLRVGLLTANQTLYRQENSKQWKTAVEVLAIQWKDGVLSWAQCGGPSLLLRWREEVHPLAYAMECVQTDHCEGPLFSQALGLERVVPVQAGSLQIPSDSQLLLLSRYLIPGFIYGGSSWEQSQLVNRLIEEGEQHPFWLAIAENR